MRSGQQSKVESRKVESGGSISAAFNRVDYRRSISRVRLPRIASLIIPALLLLTLNFGLSTSVSAQFTGFSVPQTIQTTPFNAVTCTGVAQTAVVPNLGQTEHFITLLPLTPSTTVSIKATVQGSHDGVNFNDISDVATMVPGGSLVMGQGYFPVVRISVTCGSAAGSFTVLYSGQATAPAMQIGALQSGQIDKVLNLQGPANANFTSFPFRTPFGSTGGAIYFTYTTPGGPSGSTLSVACDSLANNGPITVFSVPLTVTAATAQLIPVPAIPCDFVTFKYTSGGASTGGMQIGYVFTQTPANGVDPCQGATVLKSSAAIAVGSATTTQLVAPLAGHSVFVCGYNFTLSGTTSPTAQFISGTGATCGGGTITQTGAFLGNNTTTNSSASIDSGGGGYQVFKGGTSQGVCLVTAGTAPSAQGVLTYIQQ